MTQEYFDIKRDLKFIEQIAQDIKGYTISQIDSIAKDIIKMCESIEVNLDKIVKGEER